MSLLRRFRQASLHSNYLGRTTTNLRHFLSTHDCPRMGIQSIFHPKIRCQSPGYTSRDCTMLVAVFRGRFEGSREKPWGINRSELVCVGSNRARHLDPLGSGSSINIGTSAIEWQTIASSDLPIQYCKRRFFLFPPYLRWRIFFTEAGVKANAIAVANRDISNRNQWNTF